jgi:hypothetical protein
MELARVLSCASLFETRLFGPAGRTHLRECADPKSSPASLGNSRSEGLGAKWLEIPAFDPKRVTRSKLNECSSARGEAHLKFSMRLLDLGPTLPNGWPTQQSQARNVLLREGL